MHCFHSVPRWLVSLRSAPASRRGAAGAVVVTLATLAGCAGLPSATSTVAVPKRQLMLVANDEKQSWTDAGNVVLGPHGRDTVQVLDIGTDPLAPRTIGSLPLDNTIAGPPTNLAINADETLALVANSLNVIEEAGVRRQVPDNRLFVIDLAATPPTLIDTLSVGRQPSGLSINRAGTLALVAHRADNSIGVLRIEGRKVTLIDTVAMGESVAHVRFTPDGKRALVVKFPGHKVVLLDIDGEKVTPAKADMAAGLWPYNVDVTPDGRLALTADNGNAGASDGQADTVSVIDLEAVPPRVVDKVVVGDGPEGLAISPTGKLAVAVLLRGSNAAKNAYFHQRNGSVVALKIDGKKVTRSNEVVVRGLPEGAVFSADGRYLYVGNFIDRDITILRVEGDTLVDTGRSVGLQGHPAAMRGRVTH